jgi:hypothetical protein
MVEGETRHGVVVFQSTSAAYASEKAVQRAGLECKIIGVPRSLSTDCCLGLRVRWEERAQVEEILRQARIDFVGIYLWPA